LKARFGDLRADYNDILIDTDWRDTTGNQDALELADMVIVPIAPGEGSVDSLKQMVRRIKIARRVNPNLWTLVVIVRAQQIVPLSELDAIRRYVGKLPATTLVGTVIHEHPSLQSAFAERLSIFEYKPADPRAVAEMHDLYRAQKMRRVVLPSISRLQRCA
jgi:chromosome partitioning protein